MLTFKEFVEQTARSGGTPPRATPRYPEPRGVTRVEVVMIPLDPNTSVFARSIRDRIRARLVQR